MGCQRCLINKYMNLVLEMNLVDRHAHFSRTVYTHYIYKRYCMFKLQFLAVYFILA